LGTEIDPDVLDYVRGHAVVRPSARRTMAAAAGALVLGSALALLFAGMPVPLAGGLVAVSVLEILAQRAVTTPLTRRAAIPLSIVAAFHGTLFVSWVVGIVMLPVFLSQASGALLLENARRQTLDAVLTAAGTYNRDLIRRIKGAAPRPQPEAPDAPAR
jgi:hypothetical protein